MLKIIWGSPSQLEKILKKVMTCKPISINNWWRFRGSQVTTVRRPHSRIAWHPGCYFFFLTCIWSSIVPFILSNLCHICNLCVRNLGCLTFSRIIFTSIGNADFHYSYWISFQATDMYWWRHSLLISAGGDEDIKNGSTEVSCVSFRREGILNVSWVGTDLCRIIRSARPFNQNFCNFMGLFLTNIRLGNLFREVIDSSLL